MLEDYEILQFIERLNGGFFQSSRGIHHGDPLSPLVFTPVADLHPRGTESRTIEEFSS